MYKHVLIATDGSPLSERAVDAGIALASTLKAALTIANVGAPYAPPLYAGDLVPNNYLTANEHDEKVRTAGQEVLDAAQAKAGKAGLTRHRLRDCRRTGRRHHQDCQRHGKPTSDRRGLAWPGRPERPAAGQRHPPSAEQRQHRPAGRPQSRRRRRLSTFAPVWHPRGPSARVSRSPLPPPVPAGFCALGKKIFPETQHQLPGNISFPVRTGPQLSSRNGVPVRRPCQHTSGASQRVNA